MTDATPLPATSCLPCQLDPEGWFDRHHRVDAVAECRDCPARRWCAREALQSRASWGVWAGVWIDGRHEDAAPHLRAIASGVLAHSSAVAAVLIEERSKASVTGSGLGRMSTPLRRPSGSPVPRSVMTAVLARSSGHCEVMAEGCRYTYDRLMNRRLAVAVEEASTPPELFAACNVCADMIAALDPKLAAKTGYLLDSQRDPTHVPFYWRRSRWVLLDRDGWLTEMADDVATA
jgi:hypothetical protein